MSKDNSFLYSGINSVSNEPRTPREAQRKASEEAYYKLKPAYDVVQEQLKKEIDNVTDLRTFVIDRTTTEQEVNTELLARKLYLSYLNGLSAKLNNIMTKKK